MIAAPPSPHYIYAPPLTVIKLSSHTEMEETIKWTLVVNLHFKFVLRNESGITFILQKTNNKSFNFQIFECRCKHSNRGNLKFDFGTKWQVREGSESPSYLVSPRTSPPRWEDCVQPFITTYDYYGAIKHSHTRNWGNNKTKLTYKTTPWTNSELRL